METLRNISFNGDQLQIYKIIDGEEIDKNLYYISFNGLYAIKWKELRKLKKDAHCIEEIMDEHFNIVFT